MSPRFKEWLSREAQRRQGQRAGEGSSASGTIATRNAALMIGHIGALPVHDGPETPMQNEAGEFYYLEGYSKPGGPDIGS